MLTTFTVTGTNLIPNGRPFQLFVDGFYVTNIIYGTHPSTQFRFRLPASTPDPSPAHYTAGMSGPVTLVDPTGIAVSDASIKFTA